MYYNSFIQKSKEENWGKSKNMRVGMTEVLDIDWVW